MDAVSSAGERRLAEVSSPPKSAAPQRAVDAMDRVTLKSWSVSPSNVDTERVAR